MSSARYREIADTIRDRINSGIYPIDTRLPSIGRLMEEFGVSGLNTIRSAESLLVSEGLLRAEQGVGVWVVGRSAPPPTSTRILEELRRAKTALDRAIGYLEGDG